MKSWLIGMGVAFLGVFLKALFLWSILDFYPFQFTFKQWFYIVAALGLLNWDADYKESST